MYLIFGFAGHLSNFSCVGDVISFFISWAFSWLFSEDFKNKCLQDENQIQVLI